MFYKWIKINVGIFYYQGDGFLTLIWLFVLKIFNNHLISTT